jgi:hypothetical protein
MKGARAGASVGEQRVNCFGHARPNDRRPVVLDREAPESAFGHHGKGFIAVLGDQELGNSPYFRIKRQTLLTEWA